MTGSFEDENQATEFVRCKIESMVANKLGVFVEDEETESFKTATRKFMKLFNMPREEKLVNRKSECELMCFLVQAMLSEGFLFHQFNITYYSCCLVRVWWL